MSHEPGRERHMVYRCECCGAPGLDLIHRKSHDEYWCGQCVDAEDTILRQEAADDTPAS